MSTFDHSQVGKRYSKDDPLGPHDVADRLDRAALRVWRIISLVEDAGEDFADGVRSSRYLTNALAECRDAINRFLGEPDGPGDGRSKEAEK